MTKKRRIYKQMDCGHVTDKDFKVCPRCYARCKKKESSNLFSCFLDYFEHVMEPYGTITLKQFNVLSSFFRIDKTEILRIRKELEKMGLIKVNPRGGYVEMIKKKKEAVKT